MIVLDNTMTTEVLDQVLRDQHGWRLSGGLFRRNRNNPQIYARDGRHIVILGPFRVRPDSLLQSAPFIQEEFEEYLRKVQDELENHIGALCPRDLTLVFSGGGSLQIPDWFTHWCHCHGVRIVFAPDPQGFSDALEYVMQIKRLLRHLEEPGQSIAVDSML